MKKIKVGKTDKKVALKDLKARKEVKGGDAGRVCRGA
jgi:hypothetical protein